MPLGWAMVDGKAVSPWAAMGETIDFVRAVGAQHGFRVIVLEERPSAGGAIGTFTEMYVKVILIFVLMVNTLTSPKRIEQFTWLIVIATGYDGAHHRAAQGAVRGRLAAPRLATPPRPARPTPAWSGTT